jgi:hypothetical protein
MIVKFYLFLGIISDFACFGRGLSRLFQFQLWVLPILFLSLLGVIGGI